MITQVLGITLMTLSPVALVTDILAILIICHYRHGFHGTDVTLISLLVAMGMNATILLPVPAFLGIRETPWNYSLCLFYVCFLMFTRTAQVLGLLCVGVHWSVLLRLPIKHLLRESSFAIKVIVFITWVISAVVGFLPFITSRSYFDKGMCHFLAVDVGAGFAILFIVINIACVLMSFICICDTGMLLRHMRRVALDKYRAGRFYVPRSTGEGAHTHKHNNVQPADQHGHKSVQDRYSEVMYSLDICRLVIIFVIVSCVINHCPYAVIEFLHIIIPPDTETLEDISLWLSLAEALALPHILWIFSRRYRHALVYTWRFHILRDSTIEEADPKNCSLQSYMTRERDENGSAQRVSDGHENHQIAGAGAENIHQNGQITTIDVHQASIHDVEVMTIRENGCVIMNADIDLDDESPSTSGYSSRKADDSFQKNSDSSSDVFITQRNTSKAMSAGSEVGSPSKHSLSTPKRGDVKRKSSTRENWKEKMRRQHLPAIFVNDAYDNDEQEFGYRPGYPCDEVIVVKGDKSVGENFYVSGNYHPDYLVDTLPRKHQTESESEGASNAYDDGDIASILDMSLSHAHQQGSIDTAPEEAPSTDIYHQQYSTDREVVELVQCNEIYIAKPETLEHHVESPRESYVSHGSVASEAPETSSVCSSSMSTNVDYRRQLWSEDQDEMARIMNEPLITDSDTDTLGDSTQSFEKRFNQAYGGHQMSYPSPVQFDEDIEKGFEEALQIGYSAAYPNGMGVYFEPVQEEPEESTRTMTPEEFVDSFSQDSSFATHAVMPKSKVASIENNSFARPSVRTSPTMKRFNHTNNQHVPEQANVYINKSGVFADPQNVVISVNNGLRDDVFESPTKDTKYSSPWPDSHENQIKTSPGQKYQIDPAVDMSFESDFSEGNYLTSSQTDLRTNGVGSSKSEVESSEKGQFDDHDHGSNLRRTNSDLGAPASYF